MVPRGPLVGARGGDMRQEGSGTPARVGPRAGGCCRSAGHRAEQWQWHGERGRQTTAVEEEKGERDKRV